MLNRSSGSWVRHLHPSLTVRLGIASPLCLEHGKKAMVKHPLGSFEISLAHCIAWIPVIVISMPESSGFRGAPKGRTRGLSYFRNFREGVSGKGKTQRCVQVCVLQEKYVLSFQKQKPIFQSIRYYSDVKQSHYYTFTDTFLGWKRTTI